MALEKSGLILVAEGAAQYIGDISKAEGATTNFTGALEGAAGRASSVGEVITGALREVGAAAVDGLGRAAEAIGGFLVDSVGLAGDFEAGMNRFGAAAGEGFGAGTAGAQEFKDLFLSLGQELPVSTSAVQEAAITLVKGGLDPATLSAGALKDSLLFAAAAEMDLAGAADLSIKLLSTFGPTAGTAAEQTAFLAESNDLLVKAANASTLGVADLGDAMLGSAGQAQAAGLAYDDYVTTMTLVAKSTGSTSEASTALRNLLVRLQPTTKDATAAFQELGLITADGTNKFYDAQGAFVGGAQAAELLQEAFTGLSDKQRSWLLQQAFGMDAAPAVNALVLQGAEGYNQLAGAIGEASGVADQAAALQQGYNSALQAAQGAFESLQITVGGAVLPLLTQLLNNVIGPGIEGFTQFAGAVAGAETPLGALGIATMYLGEAFGLTSGEAVGLAVQVREGAAAVLEFLAEAQPVADFLIANWQPALAAIGAVIGAVMLPALASAVVAIAPVVAAVGGAIAIGAALYAAWQSNFGGIQEATATAMAAIQTVITSVLGVVMQFWNENGAEITASAQQWWGQTQEIIGGVVTVIATVVSQVFGGIAQFVNEHGAEIQTVLTFAWEQIQSIIDLALNTIQGLVTTVLGVVTGDWEKAGEGIQQIVEGLGEFVGRQFENLKTLVEGVGPGLLSAAQAVGQAIIDGIVGGLEAGAGAIIEAATGAAKAALDAAKDFLGISSPSKVFADVIGKNVAAGMASGITANAGLPMAAVQSVAGGMVSAAQQMVAGPASNYSYTTYGGDSYGDTNVTINGSGLGEAALQRVVDRSLGARSNRADRLARQRGGSG